ncbi:MAG: 6-phosphogluconolactonase [Aeriscardovia sp.]|nr:6-phosphogluconolactonase [Aeriscardovia sp.]
MTTAILPTGASRQLYQYKDANILATAAASRILLTTLDLLSQPQTHRVDLAITGGGDGNRTLSAMAHHPLISFINWTCVHFWWGDERFVSVTHPERNAVQARSVLLNLLQEKYGLPEKNIHEMPADPRTDDERTHASEDDTYTLMKESAQAYQDELCSAFGSSKQGFDIIWFGVGPEGHVASLFPYSAALQQKSLIVPIMDSPKLPPCRLTVTPSLIRHSRHAWIVASSEKKREALTAGWHINDDVSMPLSFVAGLSSTIWMVDQTAFPRQS